MPQPTSIYAPTIEAIKVGQCIEFSQHAQGGRFLSETDINTIRAFVNRMNSRDSLSKSRLCVRSMKEYGAVQVYRLPKFTDEYLREIRKVKERVAG